MDDDSTLPPNLAAVKRLLAPDQGPAPALPIAPAMTTPAPQIAAPDARLLSNVAPRNELPVAQATPDAAKVPTSRDLTQNAILSDRNELTRLRTDGPGVDQIQNGGLRTLGKIGDGVLSALLPGVARLVPGTTLNNQRLQGIQQGRLNSDLGNDKEQAGTELLNAQPELKQAALDNKSLQIQKQQQHYDDQAQHWDDQKRLGLSRAGLTVDESDPTGQKTRPLRYEEMSEQQQATADYTHARTEMDESSAALKKAQNDPNSPAFQQAKRRNDIAQQNANTALARLSRTDASLGMRREALDFNEDKFYNPQPTGAERTKGDLASSAGHFVDVMHDVRNAHPEIFGPGPGRETKIQEWIGSQSPEAQRYLAAATVAKDHLTAVFGARSKYALEGTGTLFDPKMNNAAFEAEYGDLKHSIGSFQQAGTPHARGGGANAGQTSFKMTATGPNGKIGSNDNGQTWVDLKTGKVVQ